MPKLSFKDLEKIKKDIPRGLNSDDDISWAGNVLISTFTGSAIVVILLSSRIFGKGSIISNYMELNLYKMESTREVIVLRIANKQPPKN